MVHPGTGELLTYDCSAIAIPAVLENYTPNDELDASSVCAPNGEAFFASVVNANPAGFGQYVFSGALGIFDGAEFDVPTTAWLGLEACYSATQPDPYGWYDGYIRGFFTQASTADTQRAWSAAFTYICPQMGS
jgi:hypothetical protein